MKISAICLTFARPDRLQEALSCFLNQTHLDKELIILNTYPHHRLHGEFPGVKIINCETRPPNLGACRNIACSAATGEVLVTWDDDDLYLPHHLQVYAEAFKNTGATWVRTTPVLFSDKWQGKKPMNGWVNAVAFRKSAWEAAGRYAEMNVGEDANFMSRLSQLGGGVEVELKPHEVSAVYCWNNAVHHISGRGMDQPGRTNSYDLAMEDAQRRMRAERHHGDNICITPQLEHDPLKIRDEWLRMSTRRSKKKPVCLIELGRIGDIINVLPIAAHIARNYARPAIMVSREFADLFTGIGYADVEVFEGHYDQVHMALDRAIRIYDNVIVSQIFGKNYQVEKKCEAFNVESWRVSGFLHQFNNKDWKPFFDRRNADREAALCAKVFTTDKPKLLVNATHALSGPYSDGPKLLELVRQRYGDRCEVVDIGAMRLPHFYDMLGLMDKAHVLLTIDTGTLHLAQACNVPIVALINDRQWEGPVIRFNCASVQKYAPVDKVWPEIQRAIDKELDAPRVLMENFPGVYDPTPVQRRIFHVVERHEERGHFRERRRKQHAQDSWKALYDQGVIPCHFHAPYPRDAREIGDRRDLPYIKDVFAPALDQASDDDIVFWCNDDNFLHPNLPEALRFHVGVYEVVCSQRCEFVDSQVPSAKMSPEEFASIGVSHMGRDIFAATKRWWKAHWNQLGDYILGASDFDLAMCAMVRNHFGIQTTRGNLIDCIFPAEMKRGYVAHQAHAPKWAAADNVNHAPSQRHNRAEFQKWAAQYAPHLKFNEHGTI